MSQTASPGIVTPEAVVLAFETAGVGSRMIAALIDLLLQAVVLFVAGVGFSVIGGSVVGAAPIYIGLFLVLWGYGVAMETLWRGRTLGKAAMGLRVVTVEGAPIRFRHALIRGALGLIDLWFTLGSVAVLTVLLTPRNQRLGDLAAGTLVLRERSGAQAPSAATFMVPPGWEGYAATLDVSGLTSSDYQAVRAYLLRAATLDPWTRDSLGRQIATPLLTKLRHSPPAGTPVDGFLVCVAALWQHRQRQGWPVQPGGPSQQAPGPPSPMPTEWRPGESAWQGDVTPTRPDQGSAPGESVTGGGFVAPG